MSDINELKKEYDEKKSALDSKKKELKSLQSTSWSGSDVFSRYEDERRNYENAKSRVSEAGYALNASSKPEDIAHALSYLNQAKSMLSGSESSFSRAKLELEKQESEIRTCKLDIDRLERDVSRSKDKLDSAVRANEYRENAAKWAVTPPTGLSSPTGLSTPPQRLSSPTRDITYSKGFNYGLFFLICILTIFGVAGFYLKFKFIELWNDTRGNWIPVGFILLLCLLFMFGLFCGAIKSAESILGKIFFVLVLLAYFFVYFNLYKFIEL